MPEFVGCQVTVENEEGYDVKTTGTVEFEVFCGACNNGICDHADTRYSRNRGFAQVSVDPCAKCIGKRDDEIEELRAEIKELERKLEVADDEIAELNKMLDRA